MAGQQKIKSSQHPSGYMLSSCIRIVLCLIVLVFTYENMGRFAHTSWILGSFLVYLGYSLMVFSGSLVPGSAFGLLKRFRTWVDGIFVTVLTLVSGGFNSPYNFLYFFVIIDAATSQRFSVSIKTISGLTLSLLIVSLATMTPPTTAFDIVVAIPILFILGLIIAYRSGLQHELKERLSLLQQITAVASPKLGLERSIGVSLSILKTHFDADDCVLILRDEYTHDLSFFHAQTHQAEDLGLAGDRPDSDFLARLLKPSRHLALIFDGRKQLLRKAKVTAVCAERLELVSTEENDRICVAISELLDAPQLLTVPVNTGRGGSGRLYILKSDKARRFHTSDIRLVSQVAALLSPLIENARLIDHLSSAAAEDERRRIARDIHDSIIQPYLGIKLGLESISTLIGNDALDFASAHQVIRERTKNLSALTEATIENLRGVVHGLADSRTSGNTLLPSIKRFADRFAGATGISIKVMSKGDMMTADAMATELFQLAVEGLSNIRKHTNSPSALIEVIADTASLNLRITNEAAREGNFIPKSITERARALRGTVDIFKHSGSCTVDILIPLKDEYGKN